MVTVKDTIPIFGYSCQLKSEPDCSLLQCRIYARNEKRNECELFIVNSGKNNKFLSLLTIK